MERLQVVTQDETVTADHEIKSYDAVVAEQFARTLDDIHNLPEAVIDEAKTMSLAKTAGGEDGAGWCHIAAVSQG